MSHRARIEKAIALLVPVSGSLIRRCPAGMSKGQTDQVSGLVDNAILRLRDASSQYERAATRISQRRAS